MKIKYSPCMSNRNTSYKIITESLIEIDGERYEFPNDSVQFPDIAIQTSGAIIEARRENGKLYLTVLRRYIGSVPPECDGEYQEVTE